MKLWKPHDQEIEAEVLWGFLGLLCFYNTSNILSSLLFLSSFHLSVRSFHLSVRREAEVEAVVLLLGDKSYLQRMLEKGRRQKSSFQVHWRGTSPPVVSNLNPLFVKPLRGSFSDVQPNTLQLIFQDWMRVTARPAAENLRPAGAEVWWSQPRDPPEGTARTEKLTLGCTSLGTPCWVPAGFQRPEVWGTSSNN